MRMRLSSARLRHSLIIFISGLTCTLFFQNCSIYKADSLRGPNGADNSKSITINPTGPEGNGDGYHGKTGIYVAISDHESCANNPSQPKTSAIEVKEDGVYWLMRDCVAVNPPARIDDAEVYFAEMQGIGIIIVDNIVFRYSRKTFHAAMAGSSAYLFCTNRFHARPQLGVELRLSQLDDGSFNMMLFIADESLGTDRILINRSYHDIHQTSQAPESFAMTENKLGTSFRLTQTSNEYSEIQFRRDGKSSSIMIDQIRCWKSY